MDEQWLWTATGASWDHYHECWLLEGDDIEGNPCAWPNPRDDSPWHEHWGHRPAADMLRGVAETYTRENYQGDLDPLVVAEWVQGVDLQWFRDYIDRQLGLEVCGNPYGFRDIDV